MSIPALVDLTDDVRAEVAAMLHRSDLSALYREFVEVLRIAEQQPLVPAVAE